MTDPAAASPAPVSPGRVGAVLGALLAPQFIALGAPSVALPALARDLHVPFGASAWILASWALLSAVAMPLFGRLSIRIGLRAALIVGVVLLSAGSLAAAVAPTLALAIVGRAIGGIGAGAIVITVYATVTARLAPDTRPRALAIVAATGATASGCGTLLGGLLTDWPGWRLVLALPAVALVVLPFAARLAPRDRVPSARLDVRGAVLVTVAAGAVIALLQSASTGLPLVAIVILAAVAVAAALLLVRHSRRDPEGFVPVRVVTTPYFLAAGVAGLAVFAAYYGTLFAAPALIRTATGWNTALVGLVLLPAAAASVIGARLAAVARRRLPLAAVVASLGGVAAVGVVVAAVGWGAPAAVVVGLALTAAAFAGGQAVLIGVVPALVRDDDRAPAQGLFSLLTYGGSSIGPALVGGLSAALPLHLALALIVVVPIAGVVPAVVRRCSAVRM